MGSGQTFLMQMQTYLVAHLKFMCHPMLIMTLFVLGNGFIQDIMNLLENFLDVFKKPIGFISFCLYMCRLCRCSHHRCGNINMVQWLKSHFHLEGVVSSRSMDNTIIVVLCIGKTLIPHPQVPIFVHEEYMHYHIIDYLIKPSVQGWNVVDLVSLVFINDQRLNHYVFRKLLSRSNIMFYGIQKFTQSFSKKSILVYYVVMLFM